MLGASGGVGRGDVLRLAGASARASNDSPATAGPCINRATRMWTLAQQARSDNEQQFGIGAGCVLVAGQVACHGDLREARPADDVAKLLLVYEARKQGGLILPDPHNLVQAFVGDDGYAVDVASGKTADIEREVESDLAIGMDVRQCLYLKADVFILRAGIRGLCDLGGSV